MKKILFSLLAVFFIVGITTVNACETCGCKDKNTSVSDQENLNSDENAPKCIKTGKTCASSCKNKAKGTCCEGKAKSQNTTGFNFNKSNTYGKNSSNCSKTSQKKCCPKKKALKKCGDECSKACCA
ncbi:MAG: hypothetical protein VX347_04550 [Bacteroidota bacterium]|nr:hypothetical protein [Bacteroidota bacterium]